MHRSVYGAFLIPSLWVASASAAPCGVITEAGECQGDQVVYCDQSAKLATVDCPTEYGPGSTCIVVDATYGADCAVPQNEECLAEDENGEYISLFCQGSNAGCLDAESGSICQENLGPCTEADDGTCLAGNRLLVSCLINQPWIIDCPTYGGTCSAGACVGIPEGGYCDSATLCAAGLTCDNTATCVSSGSPTDAGSNPSTDAGVIGPADAAASSPDAGVSGLFDTGVRVKTPRTTTDESSSCGAVLGLNGWAWIVGLGAFLRRRRRAN